MNNEHFDVIVVGGGASGMMAAGRAGQCGKKVLLIEKNKQLGEKLKISGGGRCNITNAEYDIRNFLTRYGTAADFLFSPFSQFGVKDTFTFFESLGLPLVVQARNRAFPHTEKASDVCDALLSYLKKGKVVIKSNTAVKKILHTDSRITAILTSTGTYTADNYILATGGISHPETGSTGDGFDWLRELGHTVKDPTPTIVPLATQEGWSHILSGISLSFMKITFFWNGKKSFSKTGKILFTHFGLSGPLILNSASKVADLLQDGPVSAFIDAYPDTEIGSLDTQITKIFDVNKNKMLKNILKDIVPEGISPGVAILLENAGVDLETKVHSISKEARRKIVDTLKALPITITGLMGFDRAVVADGGVALSEIDTKTMKSKLYSNLSVTGDLLHINRPSGGFSLQICWTTGYVAGSHV
ncbi:MAG: NAD(P)/FAD-dependent oxidoreductase [bacterium]